MCDGLVGHKGSSHLEDGRGTVFLQLLVLHLESPDQMLHHALRPDQLLVHRLYIYIYI